MAKKETAKTVEKTVNTGFIDNVEALEAKMKVRHRKYSLLLLRSR